MLDHVGAAPMDKRKSLGGRALGTDNSKEFLFRLNRHAWPASFQHQRTIVLEDACGPTRRSKLMRDVSSRGSVGSVATSAATHG